MVGRPDREGDAGCRVRGKGLEQLEVAQHEALFVNEGDGLRTRAYLSPARALKRRRGREVLRHQQLRRGRAAIVVRVEGGRGTVRPLLASAGAERWPEFSPDGRWLAYGADATGRGEVYVQPYPGPGPRVQVSVGGGISPAWHANGRELFSRSRRIPGASG